MNCPVCTEELKMADRQGVEIDYCPKCRGIWLDRGELDKIIERSVGAPSYGEHSPQADDRRRAGDSGEYRHAKKSHKRESWLGDLFDF
jgi:Zn-finger nucleic acid-binding protein